MFVLIMNSLQKNQENNSSCDNSKKNKVLQNKRTQGDKKLHTEN